MRKNSSTNAATVLYRMFDDKGALLYVGISKSPMNRIDEHKRDKFWWEKITRIQYEHFKNRNDAMHAEKRAIKTELPEFNIQSNPKQGSEPRPVMDSSSLKPGNRWQFESVKNPNHKLDIDLYLYPEPDLLTSLDDIYFEGIDGYDEVLFYRDELNDRKMLNDTVPILWFVSSISKPGLSEIAPLHFYKHDWDIRRDFFTNYTPPISDTKGQLNWFSLPVFPLKFESFWTALGYMPSPFQSYLPMKSIMSSFPEK